MSSLSTKQNERIRKVIKQKLLPRYGSSNKTAKALGIANGSMSRILNGNAGTSMEVARKVAELTETGFWTLLGESSTDGEDTLGADFRVCARKEWKKIRGDAHYSYPHVPDHVWEFVARTRTADAPSPLSVGFVYQLALAYLEP